MKNRREQYQFYVRHRSQIDFKAIREELSYKNPLAVIEHNGKTMCLVDQSIYTKAENIDEVCLLNTLTKVAPNGSTTWFWHSPWLKNNQVYILKKLIRDIKKAKFINNHNKGEVTVTLPVIE